MSYLSSGFGNNVMKIAIFAVLVLLATTGRAGAQQNLPDTCLTLNWNGFEMNPDSIYVDTCLTTHAHPVFWDKGPYFIQFDTNAIKLGYGAPDSDLEVSWEAIDTAFPQLRATFEALANNIGSYTLKKIGPDDTSALNLGSQEFYLKFSNYVSNDSVTSYLSQDSMLTFLLISYFALDGGSVVAPTPNKSTPIQLFPDPASGQLNVVLNGSAIGTRVELIEMMGRVVQTYVQSEGAEMIVLPLNDLPSGCYIIRVGTSERFFIHE